MSIKKCCSLCCSFSTDYELLQNEDGECNNVYEITVKYFDPMLLTEEESLNSEQNQILCLDCWFHIKDFHEFHQTVFKARTLWEDEKRLKSPQIIVKEEEENVAGVEAITHNNISDSNNKAIPFEDHFLEDPIFKTESLTSDEDYREPFENTSREELLPDGEEKSAKKLHTKIKSKRGRKPGKGIKRIKKSYDESDNDELNSTVKETRLLKKEKGSSSLNLEKARESDAFIAEWKPELVCDLCSETASNFDKLRSHFKANHKTRFYIKCCERKFFRRCVLVNHIQLHLNPETHKCDICGKSSSTKHNLKLHKKVMHHDTKQLKCDICERLFKQKVTLERHLLTHATGSKDFICSECGKGYVAEQLLKLHIKHVHNVDRVCDQCGKTIHGFHALKKHLMEHAGIERPKFRCDVCGLELKSPNGLKRHKAAFHNDGTTIYVCGVCGKVAASENALWNHKKLVHVEERKHKCTYCEKAFKRPKTLREHIATHTGQDLYQCPHCPQTFKVSANMHHHRKKVHPVEWEEGRKNRLQQPKININQVKKQVIL